MAKKRITVDDPSQGRLFGLNPEVKPLDAEPGSPARAARQSKRGGEKATGERFIPPVNWIEDEHDDRADS